MKTILFTNDIPFNPYYGGIERATDVLAKALLNKGYTIFYLSSRCNNADLMKYDFPVVQHLLPNKKLNSQENKDFYKKFLDDNKIQLVINQRGLLTEGNFYIDSIPTHIKSITCFHSKPFGYWEISKDVLFINNKSLKEHVKCALKFITYPLSLYILKKVEYNKTKKQLEYAIGKSDCGVFLSDSYSEIVIQRCKISRDKLVTIPNPNTYSESELKESTKGKTILFVGRLTFWDKRPEIMLRIWSKLYGKNPEWSLYMIGSGELFGKLERIINDTGMQRTFLLGKQDPLGYYQKASVLCMTSAYEGFAMVLSEAMQNGVVPIVFNSFGAASDIIQNGTDGLLITPFDEDEYANKLEELIRNDEQRQLMSKCAKKSVERFNLENILSKWESLFHNLLPQ